MIPNTPLPTDGDIEKILSSLPKFERSKKADALFYQKLHAKIQKQVDEPIVEGFSWFSFPRIALVGSFAIAVLFVSGVSWAYSGTVTRGHFLYPVKQRGERVELAFAFSALKKVDAHVRFSNRRLEEAQTIMKNAPDFAFVLAVAYAHGDEIHLDSEAALNLSLTLADMRSEIQKASDIVVTKIVKPIEAAQALTKIEMASDKHIEILVKAQAQAPEEVKALVKKAVLEEDEHLAAVVEAKEEVSAAVELQKETVQVVLRAPESETKITGKIATEEPRTKATTQIGYILTILETLPREEQITLQPKIERVIEALETEKYAHATGLSRALLKRLEEKKIAEELSDMKNTAATPVTVTTVQATEGTATKAIETTATLPSQITPAAVTAETKTPEKVTERVPAKAPADSVSEKTFVKTPEKIGENKPELVSPEYEESMLIDIDGMMLDEEIDIEYFEKLYGRIDGETRTSTEMSEPPILEKPDVIIDIKKPVK